MKKRDYKAEYRRRKFRKLERKAKARENSVSHFKIASEAMKAVSTGYRQSHAMWSDDMEKAQTCIRMAFDKNDEVFHLAKVLIRKYKSLRECVK